MNALTVEYCINDCTPYSSKFVGVDNGVFCEIIMATRNMSKHNHSHPIQGGLVSEHPIFCHVFFLIKVPRWSCWQCVANILLYGIIILG